MNGKALIWALVGYLLAATVTFLVLRALAKPEAGFIAVVAAIAAMGAASFHVDKSRAPSVRDTAALGLTLSLLCLVTGFASQRLWHWMQYPDVVLTVDTIGTFIGTFVLFPPMHRAAIGQPK